MQWKTPLRPAESTEQQLIAAILEGHFPIDSHLPPERELARQLGVTRPTLREALQRMARDGWLEIQQGRPTRVRNYWEEGNLGVLGAIVRNQSTLPSTFIPNLLDIRQLLAPTYFRLAVERAPQTIVAFLDGLLHLPEDAAAYAQADWELHKLCSIQSGNPVFTLILNGFQDFYLQAAESYFSHTRTRQHSQRFYQNLLQAAQDHDPQTTQTITQKIMLSSQSLWQDIAGGAT